jgi:cytochrome c
MAPPFRTLSNFYPVGALEEAFAEGVLVGHPDMPEFSLEPEQIDDLLAYIQSIQDRRGG